MSAFKVETVRTRGISPDRASKSDLTFVTVSCPACKADVRFVEELLRNPQNVVTCKTCISIFNPVTNEVLTKYKR